MAQASPSLQPIIAPSRSGTQGGFSRAKPFQLDSLKYLQIILIQTRIWYTRNGISSLRPEGNQNILTTFQVFTNSYYLSDDSSYAISSSSLQHQCDPKLPRARETSPQPLSSLSYKQNQSSVTNTLFNPYSLISFVQYFMINDVRLHNTFQ